MERNADQILFSLSRSFRMRSRDPRSCAYISAGICAGTPLIHWSPPTQRPSTRLITYTYVGSDVPRHATTGFGSSCRATSSTCSQATSRPRCAPRLRRRRRPNGLSSSRHTVERRNPAHSVSRLSSGPRNSAGDDHDLDTTVMEGLGRRWRVMLGVASFLGGDLCRMLDT